jgi:hypothetical protein
LQIRCVTCDELFEEVKWVTSLTDSPGRLFKNNN